MKTVKPAQKDIEQVDSIMTPSAKAITIRPAEIVSSPATISDIPVPDLFRQGIEISSLPPMVNFNRVGDYIYGDYEGVLEDVGRYHSRLYHLLIAPSIKVGVWGSAILDMKMSAANLAVGQRVLIQYVGSVGSSEGRNPARDFRVMTLPKEVEEKN